MVQDQGDTGGEVGVPPPQKGGERKVGPVRQQFEHEEIGGTPAVGPVACPGGGGEVCGCRGPGHIHVVLVVQGHGEGPDPGADPFLPAPPHEGGEDEALPPLPIQFENEDIASTIVGPVIRPGGGGKVRGPGVPCDNDVAPGIPGHGMAVVIILPPEEARVDQGVDDQIPCPVVLTDPEPHGGTGPVKDERTVHHGEGVRRTGCRRVEGINSVLLRPSRSLHLS